MNKTRASSTDIPERLLLNTPELQSLLGCGYSTVIKIGSQAEARVQVGKRVLWKRHKIESFLERASR